MENFKQGVLNFNENQAEPQGSANDESYGLNNTQPTPQTPVQNDTTETNTEIIQDETPISSVAQVQNQAQEAPVENQSVNNEPVAPEPAPAQEKQEQSQTPAPVRERNRAETRINQVQQEQNQAQEAQEMSVENQSVNNEPVAPEPAQNNQPQKPNNTANWFKKFKTKNKFPYKTSAQSVSNQTEEMVQEQAPVAQEENQVNQLPTQEQNQVNQLPMQEQIDNDVKAYEAEKKKNQDEKVKEEVQKIEQALKILGVSYDNENNRKVILDYSRAVANFNNLLERQKQHFIFFESIDKDNNALQGHIKDLENNWEETKKYFESLMEFFINPPSKEIFELTNYSALLQSVYQAFKNFSTEFEKLNIDGNFKINADRFRKHIDQIENFEKTINAKLETMAKSYDVFLNNFKERYELLLKNFIGRQEDSLKDFNAKLADFNTKSQNLSKTYDDFLNKKLKFFKGGLYGLIFLCIFLALGAGGLGAFALFQWQEIKSAELISQQIENLEVEVDDKSITFLFSENVKIVDENGSKKVILTK